MSTYFKFGIVLLCLPVMSLVTVSCSEETGSKTTSVGISNASPSSASPQIILPGGDEGSKQSSANKGLHRRHIRLLGELANRNSGAPSLDVVGFGEQAIFVSESLASDRKFSEAQIWESGYFTPAAGWTKEEHLIRFADVNGDKKSDIVGFGDEHVFVALAEAQGSGFERPKIWLREQFTVAQGWSNSIHSRVIADVNGDGSGDIIGFGQDAVYVSLSVPDEQRFDAAEARLTSEFRSDSGWNNVQNVRTAGDFNGDGRADLIGFGNDDVFVALADSEGSTFLAPRVWASGYFVTSDGWTDQHVRTVADVNGDGLMDIIGFGEENVFVGLASEDGGFSQVLGLPDEFSMKSGWKASETERFVADVNGDNRADLIGIGPSEVRVALAKEREVGFEEPKIWESPAITEVNGGWLVDRHTRGLADVNGDGLADFVGAGEKSIYTSLAKTAESRFTSLEAHLGGDFTASAGWSSEIHERALGDVNNDGKDDIIGFGDEAVYVALSRPDRASFGFAALALKGNFSLADGWTNDKHVRRVADVNGDGRVDIVAFGDEHVFVALANSQEVGFENPSVWLKNSFAYADGWRTDLHERYVADVNGDGLADIIGFGSDAVYVSLAKVSGAGFSAMQVWLKGNYVGANGWSAERHKRVIGDVNGDGLADLIGFRDDAVFVSLANGEKERFELAEKWLENDFSYDSGWRVGLHDRFVGDVNGDRRADIIGFGEEAVYVALAKSDGSGFEQATSWISGIYTSGGGWQ